MSFEYITDKDTKPKKLNDDEVKQIAERVTSDFDNYNRRRQQNLDQADQVIKEIFFKTGSTKLSEADPNTESDKYEHWRTKIKMCKTYMFYQVLRSFIWKNTYANPSSMFDVSGENQEADNDSNKQKAYLVDIYEKMNFVGTCDKIIEYALQYGELISFVAWKKKSEEYRKRIGAEDMLNPKALMALAKGKFHYIAERQVYDNPYIYAVNPADLVFDVAQEDNWDECPKIYRSYKVPEDIINNKYYKVSKEVAEAIKNEVDKDVTTDSSQLRGDLEHKTNNSKTVEVLEHWGNLTLKDGTVLKNWHVVVVARKYVVRFDKNKRIVNPFTRAVWIRDPETGRGISPIYCVLSLALLQEDLMNRTADMQTLSENPPIYAPKGFFDEEEVKLYPGKIIEFGDNLSPAQIKAMEFSVSIFLQDVSFLSDLMAEVSGIFPNMAGADESRAKTATEISTKTQGQMTRLSMLIDTINQGLIVDGVKKVAKLCADFKTGNENIFVNKGTDKETITITDAIRQAEYRYTYADRTATAERSNKADLVVQAVERFAQFTPLNVPEIFTWYMEQKDVENPERFLQQQNTIPPEIQQALLQRPEIQAIVEQYNLQKEAEANGEEQAPQAVIPDASIPEAQPME